MKVGSKDPRKEGKRKKEGRKDGRERKGLRM
jgi:hypothetical protein